MSGETWRRGRICPEWAAASWSHIARPPTCALDPLQSSQSLGFLKTDHLLLGQNLLFSESLFPSFSGPSCVSGEGPARVSTLEGSARCHWGGLSTRFSFGRGEPAWGRRGSVCPRGFWVTFLCLSRVFRKCVRWPGLQGAGGGGEQEARGDQSWLQTQTHTYTYTHSLSQTDSQLHTETHTQTSDHKHSDTNHGSAEPYLEPDVASGTPRERGRAVCEPSLGRTQAEQSGTRRTLGPAGQNHGSSWAPDPEGV